MKRTSNISYWGVSIWFTNGISLKTKSANKLSEKDSLRWVSYKNSIKVEEALNIEFEKLSLDKGKGHKSVINWHYQDLYLGMPILTPTVRGDYQLLKFCDNYNEASKDKKNDYVYLPSNDKEMVYHICNT